MSKGSEGETNIKRMGRDRKKEKRGKTWGEINIKPKEWDETVRERRKEKTGAR